MTKRLLEPILEGGIRHVHFFNGRRLTAEDLKAEQDAGRKERERLGLGVGSGIISGFEVSETAEILAGESGGGVVLKVRAGAAINGLGQTLALSQDQQVALLAPAGPLPAGAGLFAPCEGAAPVEIGTGSGAYILIASPVSGFEGRAPMSGLDSGGKVTGCGSRYAVAGVRFSVVPVELPGGAGNPGTLRNRLAHYCFGTEALLASYRFPPEGPGKDRLLEAAPELEACDVPLALLYWSDGGIRFLDLWAVRRRVTAPFPASEWLSFAADGRLAVAEAIFLQFQDEVDWLVENETGLKAMPAQSRFRFLPAAGFLPVGHNEFDALAFFRRERFIQQIELEADPAFLREWVHRSYYLDPIDVNDPPPIVIYRIPGVSDYVFFMRQDASALYARGPQESLELLGGAPDPVLTGVIEVDLALAENAGGSGASEEIRAMIARGEQEAKAAVARGIRVTATDELGVVYEGKVSLPGSVVKLATRKRFARSVIGHLEPGAYTVSVQSKLFRPASKQVKLVEGATERVLFQLVPGKRETVPGPGKVHTPAKTAPADWMEYGWYDKMAVMEAYVNPRPLPEEVREWDFVTDPPPDVKEWLVSWSDWATERLPDAAVDPGDARIVIHPDYVPGADFDEPYAYIEFGEGGANVPVVLVANHTSLEGPVSVQSAGVSGVDQDAGMRLWQLGAGEVDIAASAWTGLLHDAGFTGETAKAILADARAKAEGLKASVKVVPGVDANVAATLEEKGIDSAVKLANADPARLKEALGIDRLAADVVVEGARKIVPKETWSLDDPDLGLSENQVKALEEIGVKTKGDLVERAADEISEKAGIVAEEAGAIIEKSARVVDTELVKANVREKTPVTVLKEAGDAELDPAMAKNLAKSGVKNLKDLAGAGVDRLAALTGDRAKAQGLIEAAKSRLGLLR